MYKLTCDNRIEEINTYMKIIHAIQTDSLDNDASVVNIHTKQYAFAHINKIKYELATSSQNKQSREFWLHIKSC